MSDAPPSRPAERVSAAAMRRFDPQRLAALVLKESLQAMRDPSTLLIAFVLPVVLLFLFAYAVSLDVRNVRIGVVQESQSASANALAAAFAGTRYLDVRFAHDRREVADLVVSGKLRGFVVIPQDFERRIVERDGRPLVQTIADGSQPNTANYVANYTQGVVQTWRAGRDAEAPSAAVTLEPRYWFNAELESRRSLVPGAIAIVMTIIGTMLTALVVAREWERGTMEAVLSTPASVVEILIGKLLPYFALGMAAMGMCVAVSVWGFGVPFRGSPGALAAVSAVFLLAMLALGLLISTLARNQFVASQFAIVAGFLPAFLLSGFIFEIGSMPWPIRTLTRALPARYLVSSLQTIFLAGDVASVLVPDLIALVLIAGVLLLLVARTTRTTLD